VLSVADRGLHYGDGLFETMDVALGAPRHWDRHLARLLAGCARLGMPAPDPTVLCDEALSLCAGVERGVLKLLYTRGADGRGYRPGRGATTRILMLYPPPCYPSVFREEGVKVRICRTPIGTSPSLGGLKHLNRLEQVLARAEWEDPDIPEGLMLDGDGRVIEATQTNLFIVREDRLLTPDVSRSGVAGVMRGLILEYAPCFGLEVRVCALSVEDVQSADEVFLCGSVIGIWPVRQVEQARHFTSAATTYLAASLGAAGLL
jgi:4-amino-4-deoxychorismate lyase